MQILVGLGNPGSQYARHRHNVGFMALDAIAERHGFGPWRRKFQGEVAEGRLGGERVLLLKPQTYMNDSGRAVQEAARFYKTTLDEIIVFHDELDLVPGKIRVKTGGGAAGHNGLRSMTAHLGADFVRCRIGIGHPGHKDRVSGHVLGDFAKADAEWLTPLLDSLADAAPALVVGDPARFMSDIARNAPRPDKAAKRSEEKNKDAGSDAASTSPEAEPPARRRLGKWDFARRLAGTDGPMAEKLRALKSRGTPDDN
ncbi:MAG: aminoacyl-tRNA hydrolase [Pseudomonadota bacterium]